MKAGDLIELSSSTRKNGRYAGKLGLVVVATSWGGYIINVDGEVKKIHTTQIARTINESR